MCGRMSLFVPDSVIRSRWDVSIPDEWAPSYNIAPQEDLLAIRNDEPDQGGLLTWGLVPSWIDDPDEFNGPINARAETVAEKSMFRDAFDDRRCLILADGFYEWKGSRGSKRPYRIERTDGEPFAFAGLWERWQNGDELRTCTILTTKPNETVEPIHDRMPVILEPDEEDVWLGESHEDTLEAVMSPYPNDELEAYEISTRVNDPANDDPSVVEPIGGEQSGLGDFSA